MTVNRIFKLLVSLSFVGFGGWWVASSINETRKEEQAKNEKLALNTLPYLNWAPVTPNQHSGVTAYVRGSAYEGLNFFNATTDHRAHLLDMEGQEVHRWAPEIPNPSTWQHAHLLPDGSILAVAKDRYLAKVRWDSSVEWIRPGRYHHDVSVSKDGKIFSLRRTEKLVKAKSQPIQYPIVDDRIDILSSDGELITEISVFDVVSSKVSSELLKRAFQYADKNQLLKKSETKDYAMPSLKEGMQADVLHSNTVLPLDRTVFEGCQRGDVLISVRNINLIGCVNLDEVALRWSWGQQHLSRQHHPSVLQNGNILIFNNRPGTGLSEVVEINPATENIEWRTNKSGPHFYSLSRGSAQRLPNGNTLISESDFGRVFEITKEQNIVWEFFNTETQMSERTKKWQRGSFYRFSRLEPAMIVALSPFLEKQHTQ